MDKSVRKPWTRRELIAAVNLYCRTPFGRIHTSNPEIIALADRLGRTPGSVSYKLANFASLDPSLPRKGASNVSRLDREVWAEFYNNWEEMAFESEKVFADISGKPLAEQEQLHEYGGQKEGLTRHTVIKARVNQNFFRKMVLAAYGSRCCLTGLPIPQLLVASHIVPWSRDIGNRLNPRNGLCLNALHDRAFDQGLITLSESGRVLVTQRLRDFALSRDNLDLIKHYENRRISPPSRFLPDKSFLEYHRDNIFLR